MSCTLYAGHEVTGHDVLAHGNDSFTGAASKTTYEYDAVYWQPDEIHFVVHYSEPLKERYQSNRRWSGFVGFRFVKFTDQEVLVSWCCNCACGRQTLSDVSVFEGDGFNVTGLTKSQCIDDGAELLCSCARQLLDQNKGMNGLKTMINLHLSKGEYIIRGCCFLLVTQVYVSTTLANVD